MDDVVVTGIGMVTALGQNPGDVLRCISDNDSAAAEPGFDSSRFDCPVCASIQDFDAELFFPENKTLRLMNRDAQMAVAAAKLAMDDAKIKAGQFYLPEDIALYGSTGVASMSVEDIERIIRYAADEDGTLNLESFGKKALKRIRPVLSFRILANMPICFVSILQNIKGPNAVYTPWEGHGAQAIAAGIRSIKNGDVQCALVGGCDVKTRELSFINLQQCGVFESWTRHNKGPVPGEGSVFMVLENEESAFNRGKKAYARISDHAFGSTWRESKLDNTIISILSKLNINETGNIALVSCEDDVSIGQYEKHGLESAGIEALKTLKPKLCIGNLFAAAAAGQVALAAQLANDQKDTQQVVANCFGYGSEQASFVLESV